MAELREVDNDFFIQRDIKMYQEDIEEKMEEMRQLMMTYRSVIKESPFGCFKL